MPIKSIEGANVMPTDSSIISLRTLTAPLTGIDASENEIGFTDAELRNSAMAYGLIGLCLGRAVFNKLRPAEEPFFGVLC